MVSVLQESAPSYTMVKKWARLFQQGRESCEDDPRPGRPVTVVTEENVRKIEKLVLADRRIKLWQIAEELHISKERVEEIIHEHVNMRKISARWVPKMLTPFDKQRRLQTSKDFLELVGDNIDEICDRIVTVNETWVRQYDPESKQESCNGRKRRKAAEEIQGSKSASKLMATIFGIVKVFYLLITCQRDYYEWPILREFIGSGTRGSRTEATWEVIARSAVFTRQCICSHGAGFEAGPEGHGHLGN
ncbi:Putative uncharacterized protein FLJ37770 [Eumeta japonica]|uniref:Histone-lysine N-methyltransferase SETMAR n=1 Tax=Eumeta variegata TaxID=151549 RepID=A0A4C1VF20_EUMVA|nr:Putative uncharacterized protein FLJ37770 [Eumeta japonica]